MIIPDQVVRLWERESGKAYTSIEATAEFNDIVLYPKSGLVFLANEQPKMQVGLPHCKEWMGICLNFYRCSISLLLAPHQGGRPSSTA